MLVFKLLFDCVDLVEICMSEVCVGMGWIVDLFDEVCGVQCFDVWVVWVCFGLLFVCDLCVFK